MHKLFFAISLLFCVAIFATDNSDRILRYHSDIKIDSDGQINVTETIKIYNGDGTNNSSNDEIKRGIFRMFPTIYKTKKGFVQSVPFKLIAVTKNGEKEPYHIEKVPNGVNIYIGSSDIYLNSGIYEYKISYTTAKQIIFHEDKDEFYWNVNGNNWSFSADMVSCKITFPENAKIVEDACYTGFQGSTNRLCESEIVSENEIFFKTVQRFLPNEGLTVAASIQKGIIEPISSFKSKIEFAKDNASIFISFLGVLVLILVNLHAWHKYGRDPKKGTIMPQFAPPHGMSPADVGYLLEQSYKPEHFSASILDYAVNKLVTIEVEKEGLIFKHNTYTLLKPAHLKGQSNRDYTRYEQYGYDIEELFGTTISKKKYNSKLATIYHTVEKTLERRLKITKGNTNTFKGLFKLNDNYILFGIFFTIFLFITCFVLQFFYPSLLVGIYSGVFIVIGIIAQIVFAKIHPAYTTEGRQIADHILGFKKYLESTEQHIFNELNPPEMNIQLFEKYLPYAVALKCENDWASKFEDIIASAIQSGYSPTYFSGGNMTDFSSSFSSTFTSSVSSATTPPSSSGGSSGGGFSGGGGGGGGGGGW